MLRVLLLLEDYGEMVFLQILLKKLGFDVEGIQNPHVLSESLFRFYPDLLIMTARGRRVHGEDIFHGLRRSKGKPTVILLAPKATHQEIALATPGVEALLESPINAIEVIESISKIHSLDAQLLVDKYKKFKNSLNVPPENELSHGEKPSAETLTSTSFARTPVAPRNYSKYLDWHGPPPQNTFLKETVLEHVKKIRKNESEADRSIDQERMAFVRALFKKREG